MSLINNHAAAALQHGYTKSFGNKSENVIFYDVGASSVEAALVKYSSFDVKEGGRMATHSQFEVKDVAWDANLGVQDLDILLVNHFADQFEAKHAGSDIRSNPRAVAKLKRQVTEHVMIKMICACCPCGAPYLSRPPPSAVFKDVYLLFLQCG